MGLAERGERFGRLGIRIFAICIDPVHRLTGLQKKLGEAVTLLSDPEARAIDRFGMLDAPLIPRRVARAGTYYVDPAGILRQRWLPAAYRLRPDPEEILAVLR